MAPRRLVPGGFVTALVVFAVAAMAQEVVVHEPWLNWDFFNQTGQDAYDFDIIVDSPTFVPTESMGPPGWTLTVAPTNGGNDTLLHWSGLNPVPAGGLAPAHVGAYMGGSGPILDAYWTDANGQKIGLSLPITYELTRVTYPGGVDPAWLGMRLSWPDSFFDVYLDDYRAEYGPAAMLGLTGIQTFAQIPSADLDLGDLNLGLDLSTLAGFATAPLLGGPGGLPIAPAGVYTPPPDSFFDVFVQVSPLFTPSPAFESLLFAQVVVDVDGNGVMEPGDVVLGNFWNLNRQSPEPSTGLLIVVAGLALGLRRRPRTG